MPKPIASRGNSLPAPGKRSRNSRKGPAGTPQAGRREGTITPAGRHDGDQPKRGRLAPPHRTNARSEEHTSELQSLMRSSYAVFCFNKKKILINSNYILRHKTYDIT